MKRKIFLILPIIVLMIIIVIITITTNNKTTLDLNTNLALSTTKTKISSEIIAFSNEKYPIGDIETKVLTLEEEEKILNTAKAITNAFNDIENTNYIQEIEKYTLRVPSSKLDEYLVTTDEFKKWEEDHKLISALGLYLQSSNYTFKSIKGAKITYSSTERSIVQVYIDEYNGNIGSTKVKVDAIFEYEIVFEESSKLHKVKSMVVEWVNDIDEYYQRNDIAERTLNNSSTTTLSNVSSYIPTGYTNFDYSKLEQVSSQLTDLVYEKNKDSVVIIDTATEGGLPAGTSSGFFIRSGIIVTTYNSVYSMIENGAARYYAIDSSDNIHEIAGIVSAYPDLNLIILKLKEEVGTKVQLGDATNLNDNDPILVISSSLGLKSSIKLGIYFDTLDDDYRVIRTSLPLIDGDNGSVIFNLDGEAIAINTNVSTSNSEYNSGLNNAIDINILKEVINKIEQDDFNDIKSVSFDEFNEEENYQVINKVNDKIWKKYETLPLITNITPLNLYSAYTSDKYLIIRYKQNKYSVLENDNILALYSKTLLNHSYIKISDNVYEKDGITIRLKNNLGYLIVIVEGVV